MHPQVKQFQEIRKVQLVNSSTQTHGRLCSNQYYHIVARASIHYSGDLFISGQFLIVGHTPILCGGARSGGLELLFGCPFRSCRKLLKGLDDSITCSLLQARRVKCEGVGAEHVSFDVE